MDKFKAIRSYCKGYTNTTEKLNEYLEKGYEVVMVTPFIKNNSTEYLEYILKQSLTDK